MRIQPKVWLPGLVVLLLLFGGGFFLLQQKKQDEEIKTGAETDTAESTPAGGAKPDGTPHHGDKPTLALETSQPESKDGCFTLTFRHQKLRDHADGEKCTRHQNLIHLAHVDGKLSSVCIRVNGTPVEFRTAGKSSSKQFMFGAVAGPDSIVTARYCTGKASCKESCVVPKDEFMAAIGGGDADELFGDTPTARWNADGAPSQDEAALDREMKDMKDFRADLQKAGEARSDLFKGWIAESKPEEGCTHHEVAQWKK